MFTVYLFSQSANLSIIIPYYLRYQLSTDMTGTSLILLHGDKNLLESVYRAQDKKRLRMCTSEYNGNASPEI
jgi:hypothetical protein